MCRLSSLCYEHACPDGSNPGREKRAAHSKYSCVPRWDSKLCMVTRMSQSGLCSGPRSLDLSQTSRPGNKVYRESACTPLPKYKSWLLPAFVLIQFIRRHNSKVTRRSLTFSTAGNILVTQLLPKQIPKPEGSFTKEHTVLSTPCYTDNLLLPRTTGTIVTMFLHDTTKSACTPSCPM